MGTITAANAQFSISVPAVSPIPVQLQGFATDDAFTTEPVSYIETRVGVDGIASGGFVPALVPMTIMLQADSPSIPFFDNWQLAQLSAQEVYTAQCTIYLPSIGKVYNGVQGFLKSSTLVPGVKKVLEAQQFVIDWSSLTPSATYGA
jgi:hypothetical protein